MIDRNEDDRTVRKEAILQPDDDGVSNLPERIGRYRVLRLLGQGGFGRVYLAHDDDLERPVAIKMPNPERATRPEDVEAYLAEARILARLDHPHIVPVHEVGHTEDGVCFIVSKLIEGSDLASKLRSERPSSTQAAELVATIAEALHFAHTRGLVHRDIKPANILIDASGKAFVADFGLALKDEDFGKGARLAGTPAYMSPEQARGEGHRVDGRSDIFSLGVVFYELLTGRRPFTAESRRELLDLIARADPRPPRMIDDTIPKELERVCLKALSRRASERYTTARDMAEDLRIFLQTAAGTVNPAVRPVSVNLPLGSAQEVTPVPSTSRPSDSDQEPIKIIPKGLRSFDEGDADFFLGLLPGPRDRSGLPESIRFWKQKIEQADPDKSFRVGLIYGPSGCGKSSLIRAGLLPRLAKHVRSVYIEATPEETEARVLKALRKECPDLPSEPGLVDVMALVRQGRVLRHGQKVLLVLDQFEQWLHARRSEQDTKLVAALRQCDGEHLQAIVLVRDDFWMAATRFMSDLEIELLQGQNVAAVDLFDPRHARKVLAAFGQAYGTMPEHGGDRSRDHDAFLDQAITELAQDGKVICVRLALFAEMVKGKPWTPASLRAVGGTEGVGVTFLEETFASPQANPRHRLHQKAAQAVLKALLPESGTNIKGQMRSQGELQEVSGYAERSWDFADLIHVLDRELRLITPTDPAGVSDTQATPSPSGRFFQLTHDYLVPSLRDWLTHKQRETRRGRAELRLGERSALWNAKPENRLLPSVLEWANIRWLTRVKDWTEPQQRMMKRAGRVHGLRTLGVAAGLVALVLAGFDIRRRVVEANREAIAAGLVDQVVRANIAQVPNIVKLMAGYRRWVDPALRQVAGRSAERSPERLHASLALLPVDDGQVEYLFGRLQDANADEVPVLRDALKPHQNSLAPRLWSVLDSAQPGDASLLPAASSLALYDPQNPRWTEVAAKVARGLVTTNLVYLRTWLEALRPVGDKLTAPLITIFRDKQRPETERTLATDILTDYASHNPSLISNLLMDADPKAYAAFFPIAQRQAAQTLPLLQAELARTATFFWDDPHLDPSWAKPETAVVSQIEAAEGMLVDRFGFCQTMPLEDFLRTAEGLRKSGYRPIRFRPYPDGRPIRVAAVWTRDGRKWRLAHDRTADETRQTDERNRKEGFLPADVAGYAAVDTDGQPAERYAVLWVERAGPDDEARLYVGATAADHQSVQDRLKGAKLIPRTMNAMLGSDGRTRYSGVWSRFPAAEPARQLRWDQSEGSFQQNQVVENDKNLIDVTVSGAEPPRTARERAQASLETAENNLKAKPDDLNARFARATALTQLGEDRKALDDLGVLIEKAPQFVNAYQYRAMAHARLGRKKEALDDLAKFLGGVERPAPNRAATESSRLYLTVVVAAELGEGEDEAFAQLDAALKRQPNDPSLGYDAARAYALASRALAKIDRAKGGSHAERAIGLLRAAIRNGYSDYDHIQEDSDLDPIRDLPAFAEIRKGGHPDRRYAAVWAGGASDETIPSYGLDPAANLQRCRELASQGYRMVALSVIRSMAEGPLVTASVWHRPVVKEAVKDQLAERQARAAVALVRLGRADEVWPLLRHSADPRLRSFIVNWLDPLGADPNLLAAELARFDSARRVTEGTAAAIPRPAERGEGGRRPGEGSSAPATAVDRAGRGSPDPALPGTAGLPATAMDAILFHPATSARRALILALGTYGPNRLSPAEREPLIGKLLGLYEHDPDAGIHGAAEWTLRKWEQPAKVDEIDAKLRGKDRGNRRWYVNSQGQTFAVIDGPVEFRMGSPPSEPDREAGETPHRRVIPRRFAIAGKEVTVEQYQRFAGENPQFGLAQSFLDKYSPEPNGPMIAVSWYGAAAYCNWLSKEEGLPKDQWCYLPNERGAYDKGMTIPADVLRRKGYRLPTEAEWEYACRAGTVTGRYYGQSLDLLGKYAWYQANSKEQARACGLAQPNDLGLFDMLGNVYEWCQERYTSYQPGRAESMMDDIIDETPRLLLGGTFTNLPASVRSADRLRNVPSYRVTNFGFRLARTYN